MESLSSHELLNLLQLIFPPIKTDKQLSILVDLPFSERDDKIEWKNRRTMAMDWKKMLQQKISDLNLKRIECYAYASVDSNNAELPRKAYKIDDIIPDFTHLLSKNEIDFKEIYRKSQLIIAPTQFSTTAPLKVAAKKYGFRAATMPGFSKLMIPALRIDYALVHERCHMLKIKLDKTSAICAKFLVDNKNEFSVFFDTRYRMGHASSGQFNERGSAGNVPSGESYIVPYEGEKEEMSKTKGQLPVQFGDEIVVYEIEENRAVRVNSDGHFSDVEQKKLFQEPAYGNIAELGFGVLSDFGLKPINQMLLDEKLGFHVAFGRSDHFGGIIGPGNFSRLENVVHIDRIYIPQTQPKISIEQIDFIYGNDTVETIMKKNQYLIF